MLRFQSPPSSVSQKVPAIEPPARFRPGAPMKTVARFQILFIFLHLPNSSLKFPPIKKNHAVLSKALGTSVPPPIVPQTGPL